MTDEVKPCLPLDIHHVGINIYVGHFQNLFTDNVKKQTFVGF